MDIAKDFNLEVWYGIAIVYYDVIMQAGYVSSSCIINWNLICCIYSLIYSTWAVMLLGLVSGTCQLAMWAATKLYYVPL